MNIDFASRLPEIPLFIVPFLFALCFHEFAHAWVAKLRGDRTAEMLGRLTLNPMAHADLIGTIILPIFSILFNTIFLGWAKPVPVNPRNLSRPRADMFWIAFAGPLSNIFLAVVGALCLGFFLRLGLIPRGSDATFGEPILKMFEIFVRVNVSLAVFNMIPIHPLDGGKVLARFLPERINNLLEEHQQTTSFILFFLAMSGGLALLGPPVRLITYYIFSMTGFIA